MKKLGKIIFGTLSAAALAAGAYYIYKNFIKHDTTDDFDEFDDDFDDLDDSDTDDNSDEKTAGITYRYRWIMNRRAKMPKLPVKIRRKLSKA